MATGFRNFADEAVSASVAGFTARGNAALGQLSLVDVGGQVRLEIHPGGATGYLYTLDAVADSTNCEVYFEWRSPSTAERVPGVCARVNRAKNTDGFSAEFVAGYASLWGADEAFIEEWFDNVQQTGATDATYAFAANTDYSGLLTISGSAVEFKLWEKGTAEPASGITYTLLSAIGAGAIGLTGESTNNFYVNAIGWGTDGDAAQRVADPQPSITLNEANLTPGGTISGTYAVYATIPTTLTVSDGTNTITIASPTITDNGDGTGSFSGTMPALPATGTTNLVLFGNVTVELT